MNFSGWAFISSVFHETSTCILTVSEVQPGFGFPCPTLSVHRLHLGKLFLYRNSHLDVLGLLVDLLLGDLLLGDWLCFCARSS